MELSTERVAEHLATLARRPLQRHPGARVNGVAPNTVIVLRSMLNAAVKAKAELPARHTSERCSMSSA